MAQKYGSMKIEDVDKLYAANQPIQDLLTPDDEEVARLIAEKKVTPVATVALSRLEVGLNEAGKSALLEKPVAELPLYDLSPFGKTHYISVGRRESQDLQTVNEHGLVDMVVSREHGLIYLKDGKVYFFDRGTKKDSERKGSRNGTWINDDEFIKDQRWPWPEQVCLAIGDLAGQENERHLRRFRLRYRRGNNA